MTGQAAAQGARAARELARAAVTAAGDAGLSLELATGALEADMLEAAGEWVELARAGVRLAAGALGVADGAVLEALLLARATGGLAPIVRQAT